MPWCPHCCTNPITYFVSGLHFMDLFLGSPCSLWSHTLVRMCTCINTCMHVFLTPLICSTPLHSCVWTCMPLCDPMCMFHFPLSAPIPSVECAYASIHALMSTQLPTLATTLCIVVWKQICTCVAPFTCPSHQSVGPNLG